MVEAVFEWGEKPLIEVIYYEQPNKYIIESKIKEEGKYPVLTPGKSFIKGYTDEENNIYTDLPVILFDDFTTATKFVNFDFKVKSSAMKLLKEKNANINLKYVFYQMQTIKINSSTHKRYYISKYQHLPFKFPIIKGHISKEGQELIVNEIEKQLTRLDESISNFKKVKEKISIYKLTILKSAFEGKFTSKEEKKEIKILTFSLKIPKSWDVGKLDDLGGYGRGKSKHRPRNDPILYENGTYPFIQTGEISRANKYVFSHKKEYNDVGLKQSKLWKKGTLCITIAANIAKTAILDYDACFPDSVIGFNAKNEKTVLFVMYYIKLIQQFLDIKASATAQKNINLGTFTNVEFPKIDEELQGQIVDAIELQFSVIDKLEETINNSLQKAEQLRKSILKSAFEGKLIQEVSL